VAVAVAGYDLCPQVSIADIIAQMQTACLYLWRRFRRHIMIYGHSAGGHLTACLLATDWPTLAPGAPVDLAPIGYAISGVFDLAPLIATSLNADLRLDAEAARRLSPLFHPVDDPMLDAVVGALESSEFLRQSQMIVEAWRQGDAETRYEAIAGANHFTVLDPLPDPASPMVARLLALTQRANTGEF
jgi:arylformamidase